MNRSEEFFESDVEFVQTGEGLIETEHPSLGGGSWVLRTAVGLISGTLLMLSSQAFATEPKVIPLEVSIAERHQQNAIARISAQNLNGLLAEAQILLAQLRNGAKTGGPVLRAETARRFASERSSVFTSEQSENAAINFVVGEK